jgi:hypothetical protein
MRDLMEQHAVAIVLGAFGLAIFLLAVAVTRGAMRAKRRKAAIRDWAFRSGFDYIEGPLPARELAPLRYFALSDTITDANASNVTRGSRGVSVTLLDLQRTTRTSYGVRGNRTNYSSSSATYALFKLSDPLPRFSFSALTAAGSDSLTGKLLGGVVGMAKFVGTGAIGDPIEIENRPGFLLATHEAERVRPLFAEERAHFFDDKCGWSVESEESWLLVSCDPTIYGHDWPRMAVVDVPQYDDFVRIATSIHDHFFHSSS